MFRVPCFDICRSNSFHVVGLGLVILNKGISGGFKGA